MKKQIRFWVYLNCPTLLKLRAGQTLTHYVGGPTDEGWSYTTNSWQFDGEIVKAIHSTRTRDCDGRMDHYAEAFCTPLDVDAGPVDPDDASVTYPAWVSGEQSQRDYSAEAAGY